MIQSRSNYNFSKTGIIVLLILLTVFAASGQVLDPKKIFDEAMASFDEGSAVSLRTSLVKFDEARKLYQERREKPNEGWCLYMIGRAYALLSENTKAVESYRQALPLLEASLDKAFVINDMAESYRSLGDNKKALELFDQALPLFKAEGDTNGEATVILNVGSVYLYSGEWRKGLEYYTRALPLFKIAGNKVGEARTLANIGAAHIALGENEKALEKLNQALPLLREIKDKQGEALALNSVGKMYLDLGEKQKALEFLEKAATLCKLLGDVNGEAAALLNAGNVYLSLGRSQKALELFDQALTRVKATGDKNLEAAILNNIGEVYIGLRDKTQALKHLSRALMLNRTIGRIGGEGRTQGNIGSLYHIEGEYRKALEFYSRALSLLSASGDRGGEAITLNNAMHAWESLGNNRLAIFYGKQSVNKRQELRQAIQGLEKETQQSFLGTIEGTYKTLADILIAEGRFPEAQAVLDLLKEEEYRQLRRSVETGETVPYSKSETDLIDKIENLFALERERSELQELQRQTGKLTETQETKLEELRLDITAANKAFDVALDALGKAESSASARVDEIKGGQEIQSALSALRKETKSGVVALYTVLGTEEERTGVPKKSKFGWVIMVTEKGYKAYPIDVANLEENVFQFRNALSSDKYDPRPLAEKIYSAVFRQSAPKLKRTLEDDLRDYLRSHKDKTLMWSLDGVLRYIPMAALHDGKQYLVESYRNVVFTKQSFLWLTKENQADWKALGLGVSEKRENFDPLPGVKTELETIVREANSNTGILSGTIKLNENFKKQFFFNSVGEGSFPVVHIASHYSFNPSQQEASFLLLGDGRLTFNELKENKNLFGTVDLLTLSACDTGVSANGKEAEGFAYLAQSLGAKSVIASLWKVSDAGTPELMIRFYKLRAENPQISKGEAFRQAQLSLLRAGSIMKTSGTRRSEIIKAGAPKPDLPLFIKDEAKPFAHPHYWSSFVLIGNWR